MCFVKVAGVRTEKVYLLWQMEMSENRWHWHMTMWHLEFSDTYLVFRSLNSLESLSVIRNELERYSYCQHTLMTTCNMYKMVKSYYIPFIPYSKIWVCLLHYAVPGCENNHVNDCFSCMKYHCKWISVKMVNNDMILFKHVQFFWSELSGHTEVWILTGK